MQREADDALTAARAETEAASKAARASAQAEAEAALRSAEERFAQELAEREAALRASVESANNETNVRESQPKLDALSRMVREQQAELAEGYRFSARSKLASAVERRVGLRLAGSFAAWRTAVALVSAAAAQAQGAEQAVEPMRQSASEAEAEARAAEAARVAAAAEEARRQLQATCDELSAEVATWRDAGALFEQERDAALRELAALRPTLSATVRVVHDQQVELAEGHRLSAASRLASTLDAKVGLRLAGSLATWRAFAALLASAASVAAPLPPALAAPAVVATPTSHDPASSASAEEGTAVPRAARKPPLPSSSSGGLLVRAVQRPTSPKPQLAEHIGTALAGRSSPSVRRASSPTQELNPLQSDLERAIAGRVRRQESLSEVGSEVAKRCEFCGLTAEHNFVSCMECGVAFHSRCMTSSQAARFKGKGWYCDEHVRKG